MTKRFGEFVESTSGLNFGRLPAIGVLDRAQVEKVPWNKRLHPGFFSNKSQTLLPTMNTQMKIMALDFARQAGIPVRHIKDILFKGSMAGYNYREATSDIDLQVILRYNWDKNPMREKDDPEGIKLKRRMDTFRQQYNKTHHLTLGRGKFPVEFFIHTPKSNTPTGTSARWSVKSNAWVPGYKPDHGAAIPKTNEVSTHFKQYYLRVKEAYVTALKTGMEGYKTGKKDAEAMMAVKAAARLAARREAQKIYTIDRNQALHAPGVSLRADIESPVNLAIKALKNSKLIAFINQDLNESYLALPDELEFFVEEFNEHQE